eukprot:358169-Chlamydomonas_euryale.AAC.1
MGTTLAPADTASLKRARAPARTSAGARATDPGSTGIVAGGAGGGGGGGRAEVVPAGALPVCVGGRGASGRVSHRAGGEGGEHALPWLSQNP